LRTTVYVDGFNLYYRAVKGTPYKWLNIYTLFKRLLKVENQINKIRYFTAKVTGKVDFDQPRRQKLYLNALETIPEVSIHYGSFLAKSTKRPITGSAPRKFVTVDNFEEKGSDVNLASYLIHDGWRDMYDVAAVVTNDTDLVLPIELVIRDIKKPVGLILPCHPGAPALKSVASFVRHIRKNDLKSSQFPDEVQTYDGRKISKPLSW
jgi:uncharacterized LabA/DUF88 family protein